MKTVLVHGVFDLLHVGHLEHFRQAKEFGDYLVVSVVPDEFVAKTLKTPVYPLSNRLELLNALHVVGKALSCEAPGPEKVLRMLRPDVYVRGTDYIGKEMPESKLCRDLGITIAYTKSVPPRTNDVIERILQIYQL